MNKTILDHFGLEVGKLYRIEDIGDGNLYGGIIVQVDGISSNTVYVECTVIDNSYNSLWNGGEDLSFCEHHPINFTRVVGDVETGFINADKQWLQGITKNEPLMIAAQSNIGKTVFVKLDNGKPEMKYLLDTPLASGEKCKVRKFGDEKYDRFNWYKCEDPERYLSACLRHLHEIAQDNLAVDPESNLHHAAHALCSLEFFYELLLRKQKEENNEN